MRATDRIEFVKALNGLAAIKGKELTPEALEIWWRSMGRWSIEEFKAAASHLATAHEWMPNPFHFEQLRKAGEPTAGEAWLTVLGGKPLEPGSRVARAAAVCGGQQAIRMANVERDLPHVQRRFKEAYDELSEVDQVRDALPQLAKIPPQLEREGFNKLLKVMS